MQILTASAMKKIDNYCIEELNIPSIILMENAALKVVNNLECSKFNSYIIVCGHGNNGGDGLAVARHLFIMGKKVQVFFLESKTLSKDCSINYKILEKLKVPIVKINKVEDFNLLKEQICQSDVVVDAIFGTGLTRALSSIYNQVIDIINIESKYVVSIDIPSGMNSDTGNLLGECIKADKTVCFEVYKRGFLNYYAHDYLGKVVIEKIGIPESVIDLFSEGESIHELKDISDKIISRKKFDHKGNNGRVTLIAGSKDFIGAAYISTLAAVKSGAGLVTLCCRENIQSILSTKLVEAMTISFKSDRFEKVITESDSIAFGPGMGNNGETLNILKFVIEKAKCPLIIDADGLNVLQYNIDILKNYKNKLILTPHLGEMSRLTALDVKYIEENRLDVAKQFAKKFEVILLLKGYNTIITDGERVIINSTGNSAMATGGMGDCLTGMISSLIGQGYDAYTATYLGAFIHGYCGDILAKEMFSVNAESLINIIPKVIKQLDNYKRL